MGVQVDEARRDHEAGRVDRPFGAAEPGADGDDPAVHDRDVADRIHAARRIHHPAAANHQAAHVVTPAVPPRIPLRQIFTATATSADAGAACVLPDRAGMLNRRHVRNLDL